MRQRNNLAIAKPQEPRSREQTNALGALKNTRNGPKAFLTCETY